MTTSEIRRVRDDDRYDDDDFEDGPDDNGDEELEATPAEREVTGELVQGELAGQTVYVPPVKQWRSSALSALRDGDFETWAEVTLSEDDYGVWVAHDPTIAEIEAFFVTINPKLGVSQGNSRASRRSSRRTRRR